MHRFLNFFRTVLIRSAIVHVRQDVAPNTADMIGVIDRFLDGSLRYELEWDDFVSWSNKNRHVEEVRLRLAGLEPLFFSKRDEDRISAINQTIAIRNKIAVPLGLRARELITELPTKTPR